MSEIGKDAMGGRSPRKAGSANLRADGAHSSTPDAARSTSGLVGDLAARRRSAADRCRQHLLRLQSGDGMWSGRAQSCVLSTARFVLLHHWIGRSDDAAVSSAVRSLENWELPGGGWATTAWCGETASVDSSPVDADASVMAYLALRLQFNERGGDGASRLDGARDAILAAGGLDACDGLSRYWLALFGLIEFGDCPAVVPESFRFPRYFSDQPRTMGHWKRAVLVPLSILWAQRPVRPLSADVTLNELMSVESRVRLGRARSDMGSVNGIVSTAMIGLDRMGARPWRRPSLIAAERWILDHTSADDGLAGSWEGTMLAVIASISLGASRNSPPINELIVALQQALVPAESESSSLALPGFHAPTLDTALGIRGVVQFAGEEDLNQSRAAVEWLLSREIVDEGDWARDVETEPSGWCREYSNRRFADVPTTAMVLLALRQQFSENPPSSLVTDDSMVAMIRANSLNLAHRQIAVLDRVAAASRRGRRWLLAMQNPDGGWGHAQRVDTTSRCFGFRPRSVGCGVQDVSTAASTGRVLQSLGAWEMACGQTSVDRAVSWLRQNQHADGFWPEQHDASRLEATCAAISGLRAVGLPRRDTGLRSAAEWCMSKQQADGGWRCGEFDVAENTAQRSSEALATSWALTALVAAGYRDDDSVKRGLDWLLDSQSSDGSWTLAAEAGGMRGHGRVPSLDFRTSVTTNAYALLAIGAFEPYRSSQRAQGSSDARRQRSR